MSLMEKLKKNCTIKESAILDDSRFFEDVEMVPTSVPALNIALSGEVDSGFSSGLITFAGPSKHFKSCFTLILIKAYLDKYKDGVCVFFDSEFGSGKDYFNSFGIDTARVFHIPITNIEVLKFEIMQQLNEIKRGDHCIIALDSLGNLASLKEVEDSLNSKTVGDMSRAKQIKSLFRMVTPQLTMKRIPMVVVNHTYKEIGLYPKDILSGGTGSYYSSDAIFIIGRQQEKDGTELSGYNFIINVEKSRKTKEKSKIPVSVTFDKGISKWSGLLEMTLESGHVIKPSNGWYSKVDKLTGEISDKKYREKDTNSDEFFGSILLDKTFKEWVKNRFKLSATNMLTNDEIDKELQ
jgi:RecA/RadA recombinase